MPTSSGVSGNAGATPGTVRPDCQVRIMPSAEISGPWASNPASTSAPAANNAAPDAAGSPRTSRSRPRVARVSPRPSQVRAEAGRAAPFTLTK